MKDYDTAKLSTFIKELEDITNPERSDNLDIMLSLFREILIKE